MSLPSRPSNEEAPTVSLANKGDHEPADEPGVGLGASMGRYVILEEIGKGGMGLVVRAYDPKLHREVALKRLHFGLLDPQAGARLLREAQAMAQLSHPNVVSVFDVDMTDEGIVLAMEFVDGQTLHQWLKTSRPRAAILAALRAAGEGLAAAHRAGLVHRDFKPTNVLVGRDGRVRVTDFGLARSHNPEHDDSLDAPSRSGAGPVDSGPIPLAMPLTDVGVVVGTPGYMAPEQNAGEEVDARSDQYAFCVTAWQALSGERPFPALSYAELVRLQAHGPPPLHRDGALPRWLCNVLRRGLEPEASDRWASMDELLHALARDPGRRRRQVWLLAAGASFAGMSALAVSQRDPGPACDTGRVEIEEVWSDADREAMRQAFEDSRAIEADAAFTRVRQRLDDYARDWALARDDACADTHVRQVHGEHLLALRSACLGSRREYLATTIQVLLGANPDLVHRASEAVQRLPSLSGCEDTEMLLADVAPPEDPQAAQQVTALRERSEQLRALSWAGRTDEALALVDSLLAQAQSTGYTPLEAELIQRRGALLLQSGDYEDSAIEHNRAYELALRSSHDRVAAKAAAAMAVLVGKTDALHAEGEIWVSTALALAQRVDAGGLIEAVVLRDLGRFAYERGTYDVALDRYVRAQEIWEQLEDPRHPAVIDLERHVGIVLDTTGEYRQAETHFRRVLEQQREAFGPEHPSVPRTLEGLAINLQNQGRFGEAEAAVREAIALHTRTRGPDHPETINARHSLGWTLLALSRVPEAIEVFEGGTRQIETVLGTDHDWLPRMLEGLAQAYILAERYDDARAQYQRSLRLRRAILEPNDPRLSYPLSGLAAVASHAGDFDEAIEQFEQALRIFGSSEAHRRQRADTLVIMADTEKLADRLSDAEASLEEALALYDALGGPAMKQARTAFELAELRWPRHPDQARALIGRARRDAATLGPDDEIHVAIEAFLREHPELDDDVR